MKKLLSVILLLFITCCAAPPATAAQPTSTFIPTPINSPTIAVPAVTMVVATTTVDVSAGATPPTATVIPTEEAMNARVSTIDGMPQVFIPAGKFRMGGMDARSAPDERPAHTVSIHAFWMDQLEVTNAMYTLCIHSGTCTPPQSFKSLRRTDYFDNPEFKDYPVVYVTWGQANAFCEWAGGRLPSEAEWERAARGDDWRTFPWGEDKASGLLANYNMLVGDTSRAGTYPLGASPFGVLDMAGNVAEWTNDLYGGTYYASLGEETVNPTGPETSTS